MSSLQNPSPHDRCGIDGSHDDRDVVLTGVPSNVTYSAANDLRQSVERLVRRHGGVAILQELFHLAYIQYEDEPEVISPPTSDPEALSKWQSSSSGKMFRCLTLLSQTIDAWKEVRP
jgi:hypothetical protein